MGIEAIGSIGSAVGSVASAVGRGASSVGRISDFGPKLEGPLTPIVNEEPVRGSLEGFKPMNASDINTIDFKGGTVAPSQPSVIAQAEAVAAAAWEKSELIPQQEVVLPVVLPGAEPLDIPQVEQRVIPVILPITSTIVEDNVFLAVNPLLESVAKTELSPKLETRVSHQKSLALSPQSLPQEQEVEEEVLVENRIKEESEVLEEEEIEEIELKDLLDEKVIEQREYDLGKATDFAVEEAEKEGVSGIEGWRIVKFVRLHTGLLSQIAKKLGRDGSLDETIEELAAKQFRSKEEAKKQLKVIVSRNEPVKKGINGTPVQEGAAAKVLKYELDKGSPSEQVAVRMEKKKKVQVNKGQAPTPLVFVETLENREPDLKTLSPELAEVFEKAA